MRLHHWLHTVPLRLRSLFRGREVDRELSEELQFHLERRTDELVARGLTPAAARQAARRELGGVDQITERCRDTRRVGWIETTMQDLRYGARVLRRTPVFTLTVALTLALGIGANTAMFSLVNGIVLRPLPYPDAQRLVRVTGAYPQGGLALLRGQARTMDVGSYAEGHDFNMTGRGDPVRLTGALVSAELFAVLGARPALGRTFLKGEDLVGQDRVAIVSHTVWQQRLGSDPSIIGHTVMLNGEGRQIVGVMPPDFAFPSSRTEVWTPLRIDPRRVDTYWAGDYMPIVGRLRPGALLADARAEAPVLQSRLRPLFPWPMPADWNKDVTAVPLHEDMISDARTRLLLWLGAVALVFGIACANVANLLLSRGATRERELALRAALGAARRRLMRQLLTESLLLAGIGAVLGVVGAAAGLQVLKAALPPGTPRLSEVTLDWRVFAFATALAVGAGLIFGLAPALQASRAALTESLATGGRSSSASSSSGRSKSGSSWQRLRDALVVVEIALAALLVAASGVLMRSFWNLSHVNPGFRSERVLTLRVSPDETWCANGERCASLYQAVLDRVRALPGLSDVALINTLPLDGRVTKRSVILPGPMAPGRGTGRRPLPLLWLNVTSPDYLRVMRIPLLRGRPFTDADTPGRPPVALVTAATAQRFWPDQDAVGQRLRLVGQKDWHTIVGIVGDVRAHDLRRDAPRWIDGTIYVPYGPKAIQEDGRMPVAMTLVVRTALDADGAGDVIRRAVAGVNAETSVSEARGMGDLIADSVSTPRATTWLFLLFAGLAVLLGVTGVYGVLSFFVSKRAREIGIRVALGAQRRDVLRLVVGQGARQALLGIALGLLGALGMTRVLSSELYGVSPTDPLVFASVAGLLFAVTLLACYVPARRALRVDPLIALRAD